VRFGGQCINGFRRGERDHVVVLFGFLHRYDARP
jgi:hypothetical protein